jgi:hypothetical protein
MERFKIEGVGAAYRTGREMVVRGGAFRGMVQQPACQTRALARAVLVNLLALLVLQADVAP